MVLGYGNTGFEVRRRLSGWPADPPRMDGRTVLVTGALLASPCCGRGLRPAGRFGMGASQGRRARRAGGPADPVPRRGGRPGARRAAGRLRSEQPSRAARVHRLVWPPGAAPGRAREQRRRHARPADPDRRRRGADLRHARAGAIHPDRGAGAAAAQRRPVTGHQRHLRRPVRPEDPPRGHRVRPRYVRAQEDLRPDEARGAGPDRTMGPASGRDRRTRARDASRLGRHCRSTQLDAGVPGAHPAHHPDSRAGRGHHRLARPCPCSAAAPGRSLSWRDRAPGPLPPAA